MKKEVFEWEVLKKTRLLFFIKEKTKSKLSNRALKKIIEKGVCKLNGSVECFASKTLEEGDFLQLQRNFENFVAKKIIKPKILYEDKFLIFINKTSNFICDKENVERFFKKDTFLVNRLDKGTSGILILAKSLEVKEKFIKIFNSRKIKKVYIAIVDGKVLFFKKKIESFIAKKKEIGKIIFHSFDKKEKDSKYAATYFEKIRSNKDFSILKCFPITGKTHQIRVHLLKLKHPILGDYQYSLHFKYQKFVPRLLLHSRSLQFEHPITNKKMEIKAPFFPDFKGFVDESIDR